MNGSLGVQIGLLARRSVIRTLRQPGFVIPAIVFPMLLLAVNAGGLDTATNLPGFPADSYLDFAFAIPFMQGALFAASAAGTDLARDIETGFLSRLSLTPVRGVALLLGQLAGIVVLSLTQAAVFLVVGLLVGVQFRAGIAGVAVLIALVTLMSLGFGGIGALMALRTGSGEAVQGLFPLLFVLLFLSSMNLPRDLIEIGWFRAVATINPVSYLVEGIRSLIITGWDARALLLGFAVAIGVAAVGLGGAAASLKQQVART